MELHKQERYDKGGRRMAEQEEQEEDMMMPPLLWSVLQQLSFLKLLGKSFF